MDISTLSLSPRNNRRLYGLFDMKSSLSSVNVSYATAEGHYDHSSDPFDAKNDQTDILPPKLDAVAELPVATSDESAITEHSRNLSPPVPHSHPITSHPPNSDSHSSASTPQNSPNGSEAAILFANPAEQSHEFPPKKTRPESPPNHPNSITSKLEGSPVSSRSAGNSLQRARARSSISIASAECQNFVQSLKEPKYTRPLGGDEIAWIFQDFYRKLKQDVLGSEDELLTREEIEERRDRAANIDGILDRAERAVTTGDLHAKLFALSSTHDFNLQLKLDSIRTFPELRNRLWEQLGIDESSEVDLTAVSQLLSKINREVAPKAKLTLIVRALQSLGDSAPRNRSGADYVLPLFVQAMVNSNLINLWQNFTYIQRFRRSDSLTGHAEYCLTSFEAAIHVLEEFVCTELPEEVSDPLLFLKPMKNPRAPHRHRSSSQSSRVSSAQTSIAPFSLGQRLTETLNSYKNILAAPVPPPPMSRKPSMTGNPVIDQRFLHADADSLTLRDVRVLLREYQRLADYIEGHHAE